MADEEEVEYEEEPEKKSGCLSRIIKWLILLLVLVGLTVGGFFLGAYLKLFDPEEINTTYKLYEYPVIGKYFVNPNAEEELADPEETPADIAANAAKEVKEKVEEEAKSSKSVVLTREELEKQMKARQAAEKKRITKLARLYSEMKPQEAADILKTLEAEMAIRILQGMEESQMAKIMAKFEPEQAAHLTGIMYHGVQNQNTLSSQSVSGGASE